MSGHKRATITLQQADQTRFTQASRHLEIVERDYNEIKARINQAKSDHLQTALNSLLSRQETYSQSLEHLDSHLSEVEFSLTQSIADHVSRTQEQFNNLEVDVWDEAAALMDQQSQTLQNIFKVAVSQQQVEFNHIHQQLLNQSHQYEFQHQNAVEAFQAAAGLFNSLHNTYDLERYFPGMTAAVENELSTAQQNIANGFYEAGLVASQQIFMRGSATRIELENYLLQHSIACTAALTKGYEILGKYDSQAKVNAVDLQGNLLDFEVDVDYWSWGEWRSWRQRCLRLVQRLRRSSEFLDIPEINTVLQQILDCEDNLPEIVGQARENILASQIRFNVAECIVCSLQEQGFYLENSLYDNADQRQPYQTTFENLEGSQITIRLSPQSDVPILHTIDLVSKDVEIRTEYELRQRAKKLRASLQSYGLQLNFSPVSEVEHISVTSPDPVRQKIPNRPQIPAKLIQH